MKMRVNLIGTVIGVLLSLFFFASASQDAYAIPSWARKYKTSCTTCHAAFPKLNAVGEAFRLNGYKFNNDEDLVKEEKVPLGQEAYKKVWPDALWPSDVSSVPPISLRVLSDFNAAVGGKRGRDSATTFETPHEAEFLAAGTLGDDMSYFFEVEWEIEEGETETALEMAWLQWEDLAGPENMFNVKVGALGSSELGLLTARDHFKLTKNHYLYSDWRLPYPDGFDTKNRFRVRSMQPGLEVNGFGARWRYAVGVVNGNGWGDNNSEKDYFVQLSYKIGGLGFDGSGTAGGEKGSGASGKGIWRDDSIIISAFGYSGEAKIVDSNDMEDSDKFWRAGLGVAWRWQDLYVGAGGILGHFDNPYGTVNTDSVDTTDLLVELEYYVYPWLIPGVRYESVAFDIPDGVITNSSGQDNGQDRARFITTVRMLLRANVALVLEGRFYTIDERYDDLSPSQDVNQDDLVAIRLDVAF